MALGQSVTVINTDGNISVGNGTSYASPTLCGLMACLWQACPWLTQAELVKVVLQSASQADCPDNVMGYGIPDFRKAWRMALDLKQ